MKSKILWALVILNVCLVGLLFFRSPGNTAVAQRKPPTMHPGVYLAAPGVVVGGGGNEVVYVLDSANHKLNALAYDLNTKRIENPRDSIDLEAVFR